MVNYTTPVLPLEIEGIDLSQGYDVYVNIVQGNVGLEKSGSGLTIAYDSQKQLTTIDVILTQAESAQFVPNKTAVIQVNWINESGVRDATDRATIDVKSNLLDREISYGDQT